MSVDVAIRLGMKGGKEVEKTLGDIGRTGSSELKQLRAAANDLSPSMIAASRSVSILKDKTEELVASTGNIGKVASSYGAAGIAVALGVTAVAGAATFAFSKAKEAAEFADNLDDTAARVGTNTTALQELQYAMVSTGGEAEDAAAGIDSFNTAIGLARSGLSAKAMKGFSALGFSKEDLQAVKSADELLPEVADRISKLGSVAEQNAVADKMGLKPLLPLLRQGREAFEQLRLEAHATGAVMDADLVKTGADANQKLELVARTIKSSLSSAFVSLSPLIADFAQRIAETAGALSRLFKQDGLSDILDKQKAQLTKYYTDVGTLNDRAAKARSGIFGALGAGATGIQAATAGGREGFAQSLERDAVAIRARAAELLRSQQITVALQKEPPAALVVGAGGSSLIAPHAAAGGGGGAAKAVSDAKARAAELGRATAEYSRLIVSSMNEEEKAAAELAKTLADVQRAGTQGGISQPEIDRRKALFQAQYEAAKALREQKADDKDADQFDAWNKDAAGRLSGVQKYRDDGASPDQIRAKDVAALDAARAAARGLAGEFTDGEYEAALKRIDERYVQLKTSIGQATVAGQLMTGVLNGQIRSWSDLGNVALSILTQIVQKAASTTLATGGGGNSFLTNLISAGSTALGGVLGKGRATGGPIYAGDRRMTGEYGMEAISARSDGYVTDAATTAAALRGQRTAPQGGAGGGSGGGGVNVVLNNTSGTRLAATARQTKDDQGRPGVEVDLVAELDGRIEQRFGQMFDGKRDDSRMASSFGVRRRLSGN